MPVLTKEKHRVMARELNVRFQVLEDAFKSRDLKSSREGLAKGRYSNPDSLCAIKSTSLDLRMAVEDFKTILAEIKKLK